VEEWPWKKRGERHHGEQYHVEMERQFSFSRELLPNALFPFTVMLFTVM
jgi:hypothetical protein